MKKLDPKKLALIVSAGWVVLLALIWVSFAGREAKFELGVFLGRFHILLVHMPIALLMLVGLLEILGRIPGFESFRQNITGILWLGVLSALAATVAGFVLMQSDQISGNHMTLHLWTGLGVAAASVGALIARLQESIKSYYAALVVTVVLIPLSAHYGGSLVHGDDYLAEYAPDPLKPLLGGKVEKVAEPELEEKAEFDPSMLVIYQDIIQPIFDDKCVQCHNENKTKGDLRMDSFEMLAKGGDYGESFVPGDPEASELIYRVTLPPDDIDFMPPEEKTPLTQSEIVLLRWWIEQGASPTLTVADAEVDPATAEILAKLGDEETEEIIETGPSWEKLTREEKADRLAGVHDAAGEIGFNIAPISAENDRLQIDVSNCAETFGDEELKRLEPVAGHIAWLDLGGSQVTDAGLALIGRMENLERLHLEKTAVTDVGLSKLKNLEQLIYLNLYGTQVTDAGLPYLEDMVRLRKLFLWQTGVTEEAARQFEQRMSLRVNAGSALLARNHAEEEPESSGPEKSQSQDNAAETSTDSGPELAPGGKTVK